MRKKFLAALLATSLAFTIAPVIPAGTVAAEETAGVTATTEGTETLTGKAWWSEHQVGKDYTFDGKSMELYVAYIEEVAPEPAFVVELQGGY